MNALLSEMKRSLAELDLGLKGDLTISEPMEKLMYSLANDCVPGTTSIAFKKAHSRVGSWRNLAYPSLRPLASWLNNLLRRINQLAEWTADLSVPKVKKRIFLFLGRVSCGVR